MRMVFLIEVKHRGYNVLKKCMGKKHFTFCSLHYGMVLDKLVAGIQDRLLKQLQLDGDFMHSAKGCDKYSTV